MEPFDHFPHDRFGIFSIVLARGRAIDDDSHHAAGIPIPAWSRLSAVLVPFWLYHFASMRMGFTVCAVADGNIAFAHDSYAAGLPTQISLEEIVKVAMLE